MIDSLTKEQREKIEPWKEEWFKIGSSVELADRPRAENAIGQLYALIGKKMPRIVWVPSPYAAKEILIENGKKDNVHDFIVGQENSYWVNFYIFCSKILGIAYKKEDSVQLQLWEDISRSCGWWWPFEKVVLISERPELISWNEKKVLHSTKGPSVRFRDGWEIYSLNGIRVTKKIVMTPEKLTKEDILGEKNVDVRREMIRQVGIERFCYLTNPKVLDRQGDYELLSIDLSESLKDCRYLKMKNPSIGVIHIEGVERECSNVQEAINWRAGDIKKAWNPKKIS